MDCDFKKMVNSFKEVAEEVIIVCSLGENLIFFSGVVCAKRKALGVERHLGERHRRRQS